MNVELVLKLFQLLNEDYIVFMACTNKLCEKCIILEFWTYGMCPNLGQLYYRFFYFTNVRTCNNKDLTKLSKSVHPLLFFMSCTVQKSSKSTLLWLTMCVIYYGCMQYIGLPNKISWKRTTFLYKDRKFQQKFHEQLET